MLKQFLKYFLLFSMAVSFLANAADSNKSKPAGAEKDRLEKAINPHFQQFNPQIIDAQTIGPGLVVVHLSVKAADHSDAFVVVTPSGNMIDIDDYALLSNIDIKKDPVFSKLSEKAPNISIWPGNHDYPTPERLADGTQQLQFNYQLLNGCHACAVGGVATLGFNFDTKGDFMGLTLIKLLPPSKVSE